MLQLNENEIKFLNSGIENGKDFYSYALQLISEKHNTGENEIQKIYSDKMKENGLYLVTCMSERPYFVDSKGNFVTNLC